MGRFYIESPMQNLTLMLRLPALALFLPSESASPCFRDRFRGTPTCGHSPEPLAPQPNTQRRTQRGAELSTRMPSELTFAGPSPSAEGRVGLRKRTNFPGLVVWMWEAIVACQSFLGLANLKIFDKLMQ